MIISRTSILVRLPFHHRRPRPECKEPLEGRGRLDQVRERTIFGERSGARRIEQQGAIQVGSEWAARGCSSQDGGDIRSSTIGEPCYSRTCGSIVSNQAVANRPLAPTTAHTANAQPILVRRLLPAPPSHTHFIGAPSRRSRNYTPPPLAQCAKSQRRCACNCRAQADVS